MDYLKNLNIHPSARIAKNATVIGDVALGEDCTVLFNATIRGDWGGVIRVGNRTNIQEGVCLHVDEGEVTRLGDGVTVGHCATVHGCDIGDYTMVGMGATVIDNAKVGSHCLIGAGALVTGTADIPDGMLVIGSPARAVRPLTDAEIENLEAAAEEYIRVGKDLETQGFLVSGEAYDPRA